MKFHDIRVRTGNISVPGTKTYHFFCVGYCDQKEKMALNSTLEKARPTEHDKVILGKDCYGLPEDISVTRSGGAFSFQRS